jgi:hypothetical protein
MVTVQRTAASWRERVAHSMSGSRVRMIGLAAVLASSGAACYSTGEGPAPPPNSLYFPVGILPSPGGKALYIVNSDFDLQFNGGTVEAYNLEEIRDIALRPFWAPDPADDATNCFGLGPNPNVVLYPGPCGPLDLNRPPPRPTPYSGPLFRRSARIGAFATDLVMACYPAEDFKVGGTADCLRGGLADRARGARLFVPVRGDRSLTFFDVDDDRAGGEQTFKLDCGQGAGHGRCSDAFRSGIDPTENTRGLTLPAEPFGIAVSDLGDAILVTHQSSTSGSVSLFKGNLDPDPDTGVPTVLGAKPRLEFVMSGLPGSATGIVAFPTPGADAYYGLQNANYQPGFAVAYRLVAQVDVVRFFDDSFASPPRPFLQRTAAFGLPPTPSANDSRDITVDTSPTSERVVCERECRRDPLGRCVAGCADLQGDERTACETTCQRDAEASCLVRCTRYPIGAYVSNRFLGGGALLIGEVRLPNGLGSTEALQFFDSVPISSGASRVVIGRVHDQRDPPGVFRQRVFVACFDSRAVIIYDPAERRVDGLIRTGRGPHALVMDPVAPIAYIGHFTDSYLGVVDLDQSHGSTYATIVATIGVPKTPQGTR